MRVPQVVGENHTPAIEGEKKDSMVSHLVYKVDLIVVMVTCITANVRQTMPTIWCTPWTKKREEKAEIPYLINNINCNKKGCCYITQSWHINHNC